MWFSSQPAIEYVPTGSPQASFRLRLPIPRFNLLWMAFALDEGCAIAMPCAPLFPIVGDERKNEADCGLGFHVGQPAPATMEGSPSVGNPTMWIASSEQALMQCSSLRQSLGRFILYVEDDIRGLQQT